MFAGAWEGFWGIWTICSGVWMCLTVRPVRSTFPKAFKVPDHLPKHWQLQTDSPAKLDSM